MPMGKIDSHNPEIIKKKLKDKHKVNEVEKMLNIPSTNVPKGDPLDFPPDYDFLMKEINKKGGIKLENCPEIETICYCIDNSDLQPDMKKSCLVMLEHIVNYGNLWIIHYNRHKV